MRAKCGSVSSGVATSSRPAIGGKRVEVTPPGYWHAGYLGGPCRVTAPAVSTVNTVADRQASRPCATPHVRLALADAGVPAAASRSGWPASSATASSRPAWPARCCSTPSTRPTPADIAAGLRRAAAALLAHRPVRRACCSTAGGASGCWSWPTCSAPSPCSASAVETRGRAARRSRSTPARWSCISINRFVLSALSAVAAARGGRRRELVTANALTTTVGRIATTRRAAPRRSGCGRCSAARRRDYAVDRGRGAVPYLLSAVRRAGVRARRARPGRGRARQPRDRRARSCRGLVAGARHLVSTPAGALRAGRDHRAPALLRHVRRSARCCCTATTSIADGVFRAGLAGLAQVVVGVAIGGGLAALVTPAAVPRRIGFGPRGR